MKCYIKHSNLESLKKTDNIRVSVQIKVGRNRSIIHKTKLRASKEDLECFNLDGTLKSRVKRPSALALYPHIMEEFSKCSDVYSKLLERGIKEEEITTDLFNKEFEAGVGASKKDDAPIVSQERRLINLFSDFIEVRKRDLDNDTIKQYQVLFNVLSRFLTIHYESQISIDDFSVNHAFSFNDFYTRECEYVTRYPHLYKDLNERNVPKEIRGHNTVAKKNQQMKAFFSYMQGNNVTNNNPYMTMAIRKSKIMVERYDSDPVVFTAKELSDFIQAEVPGNLLQTKEAFLMQCTIGARISDFKELTKSNIKVTYDGIPYFEYVAKKTVGAQERPKRQRAPIVRFVFDILKKYDFQLKILKNISGKSGYNKQIKEVCKAAGLDRPVSITDISGTIIENKPLYELVSSHTARRICQSFMKRYTINDDFLGLHAEDSAALSRYVDIDTAVAENFKIMNVIFNQKAYKVDSELNIIE